MSAVNPEGYEACREELAALVAAQGSQRSAAAKLGVSPQYLADLLHGRREITQRIAGQLGFERVVGYVRRGEGGAAERAGGGSGACEEDLLETEFGVIDLRRGAFESTGALVRDKLGMDCPAWFGFLEGLTAGRDDWMQYLQQLCGYLLTGHTSDRRLVMLAGPGPGKTLMGNTLMALLGSAVAHSGDVRVRDGGPVGWMLDSSLNEHRLLVLRDANFQPDSSWLRSVVAGESVAFYPPSAVDCVPVVAAPKFKILLEAHTDPDSLALSGAAAWVRPVWFMSMPVWRVAELKARLRGELPGILAWAVEGAREWYRTRELVEPMGYSRWPE